MQTNVHANRMVLMKLRKRLGTAKRGHTLLKHKLDELLRVYKTVNDQFLQMQKTVASVLDSVYSSFIVGSGMLRNQFDYTLLSAPLISTDLKEKSEHLLNLRIPSFEVNAKAEFPPYGFDETNSDLDHSITKLIEVIPLLVEQASLQRQIELLEHEMKVTRRRVNALEYLLIPQIQDQIRFIHMKLEEVERDSINRLMRIKDIIQKK